VPSPIPLRCFDNGGTGFLVSSKTHHWLVTCVHIVTGTVINTTDPKPFTGSALHVMGTDLIFPLVANGQQLFNAVIDPKHDDRLLDVMSVAITDDKYAKLSHFGSYDLDAIVNIEQDEKVSASGFAGIQFNSIPKPTTISGEISKFNDARFVINSPSIKGISGSAVTSDRGLVGIVYGDEGSDDAHVAATCVRLSEVKSSIFFAEPKNP